MEIGSFSLKVTGVDTKFKVLSRNKNSKNLTKSEIYRIKTLFQSYKSDVKEVLNQGYCRRNSESPRQKRKKLDSILFPLSAFIIRENENGSRLSHSPRNFNLLN